MLFEQGEPLRTRPTRAEESLRQQPRPAHLPPRGASWTRSFAWWVLQRNGWDIRGLYPDASKFIIIAAPHSSRYDWYWGMFVQWALGVRFSFMIKHVFFVPPLSWLMRWLGGFPVNRRKASGAVHKATALFAQAEKCVLLITPEGRTKPVRQLKRGFYEIAKAAEVPVLVVSFRYDERVIALDGYADLSGGFEEVTQRLHAHYSQMTGRHRGYLDDVSKWACRPFPSDVEVDP